MASENGVGRDKRRNFSQHAASESLLQDGEPSALTIVQPEQDPKPVYGHATGLHYTGHPRQTGTIRTGCRRCRIGSYVFFLRVGSSLL
jgi:hypothetical protein